MSMTSCWLPCRKMRPSRCSICEGSQGTSRWCNALSRSCALTPVPIVSDEPIRKRTLPPRTSPNRAPADGVEGRFPVELGSHRPPWLPVSLDRIGIKTVRSARPAALLRPLSARCSLVIMLHALGLPEAAASLGLVRRSAPGKGASANRIFELSRLNQSPSCPDVFRTSPARTRKCGKPSLAFLSYFQSRREPERCN